MIPVFTEEGTEKVPSSKAGRFLALEVKSR